MGTFEGQAGIMPAASGRRSSAPSTAALDVPALRVKVLGAPVAAVALALALAFALLGGVNGSRVSSAAAVHRHIGASREGLLSLPQAAQGPVSAAVGADIHDYRVRATTGGFRASNPAQRLSVSFTSSGVAVASGSTRLGLSLRGVGYGPALTALASVPAHAGGDRVVYVHPGVSEWYANGPLGLEQGFTVDKAPAGHPAGPLTLSIALSGNARASLAAGGHSLVLRHAGRTVLRYTGLTARDASGRVLPSRLALAGDRLELRVDAAGARYPLQIDPFLQQGEKLTGSGETGAGQLGFRVALSANGNTALVGAPEDNGGIGAAWVFTRSGSTWTQQGEKLTGGGESEVGEFGYSVALSANGNTALIGGDKDHAFLGAAWVFTRSGVKWTQQGEKLTGSEEVPAPSGVLFGYSVALSSEGNTALIGGTGDNSETGAAWVFTRSGEKWTQQGKKLTGAGQFGEGEFGSSVALSENGNTALIGAPVESSPPDYGEVGSVYVFTRASEKWTQQGQKLTGTGELGENSFFGDGVALSASGNTALIGGRFDNTNVGAAWVFTRSGERWAQQGEKLTGTGEKGEGQFGNNVALSSEGNIALIGGRTDNGSVGAAWVFTRSGEKWLQQGEKLTGSGEKGEGQFGHGVALSADGNTALIGGSGDNGNVGAAWAFTAGPAATTGIASEVTPTLAAVSATVNPNEETVTACKFEYGLTIAYGKTATCSPSPGSGGSPVAVSASLSGLAVDSTYHYRISATNERGTSTGSDETLTTLATSESAETKEEKKPAEAKDGKLTATASGGTGKITVGPYGEDIGGPALPKSAGKYIDAYRSATSKFTKIEVKDCELGGAKTIWWDNPAGTWEPISEPPAVYTEGSPACITVTLTESTKPSVAELTGTRFGTRFGTLPGPLEYGKCEATKDGYYAEDKCVTADAKNKGLETKGKFEWYANPVGCFPEKHGQYSESACQTLDVKKGKAKGKFEVGGSTEFTGAGGTAKLEIETIGSVECSSTGSVGVIATPKSGTETITFEGCKLAKNECTSSGAKAGTIETFPLETFIEDEGEGEVVDTEVFQDPIMTFTCGSETYTLQGGFRGETTGGIDAMSATSESVFGQGVGEQELETVVSGKAHKTIMAVSYHTTEPHEMEINTTLGIREK
jgi:hypothetical protein